MKKSRKIGFWRSGTLIGMLLFSLTYDAHSNSFIESVKGFFSAKGPDTEQTTERQQAVDKSVSSREEQQSRQIPDTKDSGSTQSSIPSGVGEKRAKMLDEVDVLRMISEDPSNPNHLFELAQLKMLDGNIADAESTFDRMMSLTDDSTLTILGKSLIQLFFGNIDQTYATIVKASNASDSNVLVVRYWCEFLLGQKDAAKLLVQNALKVPESRVSNSILASYYALIGEYDLARIAIDKVAQSGFLPAQALMAKYLYTARLKSNSDTIKDALSELRNKHQLAKEAAHLILANALMLTLNYELARENYQAASKSSSQQIAAAAQGHINRLNDPGNMLYRELHKLLLVNAVNKKEIKKFNELIINNKEASLRLMRINPDFSDKDKEFGEALLEVSRMDDFDDARMNAFLVELVSNNRFLKKAEEGNDQKQLILLSQITADVLSFYNLKIGKIIKEEELREVMSSVVNTHPEQVRLALAVDLFFDFYCRNLLNDPQATRDINNNFKTLDDVRKFVMGFADVKFQEDPTSAEVQESIRDSLIKIKRQIERQIAAENYLDEQKKVVRLYTDFKGNDGLDYDQALKELNAIGVSNCYVIVVQYYLLQRFGKENLSQKFAEYQKCLNNVSPDRRRLEQSISAISELLYLNKNYSTLISLYLDNEQLILQVAPFASVHFIDSLGKTTSAEAAKSKAREICDKLPSEICSKIHLEVIPEIERFERSVGVQKAAKLLVQVGDLIEKKNFKQAKPLLLEAKQSDPLNPFIYMFFEAVYRADNSFDFLTHYTTLLSTFLSTPNVDSELRVKLIDRIFNPCESPTFPCDVLVGAIEDNRFKDVPQETMLPAYAAQLIRTGRLEKAGAVIDEMVKSSNLNLQRKGLVLKAGLVEILKQVRESGAFDRNMIKVPTSTSV